MGYGLLKNVKVHIFISNEGDDMFPKIDWPTRDASKMFNLFQSSPFNFAVTLTKENMTEREMTELVQTISEDKTLADDDAIILVFLTYGDRGIIYAQDSNIEHGLALQSLMEPLMADKCLPLAGKPKIIILQTEKPKAVPDAVAEVIIPSIADVLYLWSRLPGDLCEEEGGSSLFIRNLTKVIENQQGRRGLCSMMTEAIGAVDQEIQEKIRSTGMTKPSHTQAVIDKELPFLMSQLREDVYFACKE